MNAGWRYGGLEIWWSDQGNCLISRRGSGLGDILLLKSYTDKVPYLHVTVCYATSQHFYAMSETVQQHILKLEEKHSIQISFKTLSQAIEKLAVILTYLHKFIVVLVLQINMTKGSPMIS